MAENHSGAASELIGAEPPTGFQRLLGYRLIEWREGYATVEMTVKSVHLNRSGVLHGGVLATLLDTACGYAGCWCPHPGRRRATLTLSFTTSYTGQISSGVVRAIGQKGPGGTRIYVCTGEVLDDSGRVIATGQGTFRYRRGSEQIEGTPQ